MAALVDSIRGVIDREFGQTIATLSEDWRRQGQETNVGSFILEALRAAGGAQVAFVNSHGIRRDVPAGPLTRQELYEVLPFRNVVVTFQLTGRELRSALEHYVGKKPPVQMSGVTCTWEDRDGTVVLTDLRVAGAPVRDDDTIVCATSDYFLGEADRYLGLTVQRPVFLRTTVFEAVERAARAAGTISMAPIPVARRHR
jgi:2',3'-cyclic-nucleotide 2'-phosphodiesterase (5'-nucleotidase family)